MSHFLTSFGDLLHFHPSGTASAPSRPIRHAHGSDDLLLLGPSAPHRASGSRADLGRFALLANHEDPAGIDEDWTPIA